MNQKLYPGPHPDADQLSIFVEGAATPREREQMLAHLAECSECRDVVFLMQRPVESASPAKDMSKERAWRRWLMPVALGGAAVAGLAVLMIFVRSSTKVPQGNRQDVAIEQPAAPAPSTTGGPVFPNGNAAPPAQQDKAERVLKADRLASEGARQQLAVSADSKTQNGASQPTSAGAATQSAANAVVSGSVAPMAPASSAPDGNTSDAIVIQQTPLRGRNAVNLQAPAPSGRAGGGRGAAAAADRMEAQQTSPPSRVGSSNSQDQSTLALVGTLSGVSGYVTDLSGAVVPGAKVALRDASGTTRQTVTGADGSFRLADIPAEHYAVTVTAPGFKTNQESIDLKPSELAMLKPVLDVGSVTQEVTVTAAAPTLELSASVERSAAAELPSRLPVASSVSLGKRVLSLDGSGSLFISTNAGKSWKSVHPKWTGKAVRIDLTAAEAKEASKSEAGAKSAQGLFQLTTDSGAQWTSKDGTHWRPQ